MTAPADTLTEFVFTFGSGMRLRSTTRNGKHAGGHGIPIADRYVAILAADLAEARAIMFALFGECWSFDYGPKGSQSARHWAGVDLYRLRELDVTEALQDLERERRGMSPVDGPVISWAQYLQAVSHDG